jgi:hypothetical protein
VILTCIEETVKNLSEDMDARERIALHRVLGTVNERKKDLKEKTFFTLVHRFTRIVNKSKICAFYSVLYSSKLA